MKKEIKKTTAKTTTTLNEVHVEDDRVLRELIRGLVVSIYGAGSSHLEIKQDIEERHGKVVRRGTSLSIISELKPANKGCHK